MRPDPRTESEIKQTMEELFQAYQRQDVEAVMALVSPDADAVWLGTGPDEKAVGPQQLRACFQRDFSQSHAVRITTRWMNMWAHGEVAWVAAECDWKLTAEGQTVSMPGMRLTAVLQRWSGHWILQQLHFSMPHVEQQEGHSFPVKEHAAAGA
jgi:ketosteroid isomerase-like protein